MTNIQTALNRVRKSERFSKEDFAAFEKWVNKQSTKYDAALLLGISRPTLDRIMIAKSGRPVTIQKIRTVIGVNDTTQSSFLQTNPQ